MPRVAQLHNLLEEISDLILKPGKYFTFSPRLELNLKTFIISVSHDRDQHENKCMIMYVHAFSVCRLSLYLRYFS